MLKRRPLGLNANALFIGRDGCTSINQFLDHCFEVIGSAMPQEHIASGRRHSAQEGAGLDAIGHHLMRTTVQTRNALHMNSAGAVTFNLGAHGDEHFGQVWNFRLLGGVFQHRLTVSQSGGHEKVFGARHRDHVGGDASAFESRQTRLELGHHVAVLDFDVRTHGLQAFDVLIHRTRPNGTTARQGHFGMAKTRQQRPQRQHRSAHGFDQLIRCFGVVQAAGIEQRGAVLQMLGRHAHVANELEHGGHILQIGHIAQSHGLVAQQGSAQLGQGSVFRTRNPYLALQSTAPANQKFVHKLLLPLRLPLCGRVGFHRQSVDFIGLHFLPQGRVHALVALNQSLAFKLRRHQGGVPMAAIALDVQMFARQARANQCLKLLCCHCITLEF